MVEREKGSSGRNNTQGCGQNGLNTVYFFMGRRQFPHSFPGREKSLKFDIVHGVKKVRSLGGKLGWMPRGGGRVYGVFRPPMTNKVRKPHDEFEKKGVIVFAELTFVVGAYLRRWGLPSSLGLTIPLYAES